MTNAALVLAAGESSRFGGSPKALLDIGGRSSVRRVVETSLSEGLAPIVVVVGAHRAPVAHELRDLPVDMVEAENWYEGRTASVQAGLSALDPQKDVLFWPIDHPFVASRTVSTLQAIKERDLLAVWVVPTYEGRGGHPVLWRAAVRRDILELRPDAPLRSLLPEFGPQVRRVPVDDPGVVANVDTPEAYREALDAWSRREVG